MGSQSSLLLIHFHDSLVSVPNKTKKADYFFVVIFYPIRGLCCTVLLLFSQWWEDSVLLSRSNRTASRSEYATCIRAFSPTLFNLYIYMFYQNEVGIGLRFPSKIRLTQICLIWRRFFWYHLRSSYHNWIDRFSDSLWDLEAKSWDRELTTQTGSLTVKLWELEGLTLHESTVQNLSNMWRSPWLASLYHRNCAEITVLVCEQKLYLSSMILVLKDIHYGVIMAWV